MQQPDTDTCRVCVTAYSAAVKHNLQLDLHL